MRLLLTYKVYVDDAPFEKCIIGHGTNQQECIVNAEAELYRRFHTTELELMDIDELDYD